ncbi:MAG: Abi family protein, partial [Gordonibacter sp.]
SVRDNLPSISQERYENFISKCKEKLSYSREPFALHFTEKYGDSHGLPPYWVLVNMMDFGQMFTLYRGASREIRKEIANNLGITPAVLDSWLKALNTARNICAHHGRLWNRTQGTKPFIPRKDVRWHKPYEVAPEKIFAVLTLLSYLLEYIAPHTQWRKRLLGLLGTRSDSEIQRMGFSKDWALCPFWSPYIKNACIAQSS